MWITRKEFTDFVSAKAQADWMKLRINQLEQERAQLTYQATGAKLNVPEIIRQPYGENPLLEMPMTFEDVGDIEASKLGIYHAQDGTLTTQKQLARLDETKDS